MWYLKTCLSQITSKYVHMLLWITFHCTTIFSICILTVLLNITVFSSHFTCFTAAPKENHQSTCCYQHNYYSKTNYNTDDNHRGTSILRSYVTCNIHTYIINTQHCILWILTMIIFWAWLIYIKNTLSLVCTWYISVHIYITVYACVYHKRLSITSTKL